MNFRLKTSRFRIKVTICCCLFLNVLLMYLFWYVFAKSIVKKCNRPFHFSFYSNWILFYFELQKKLMLVICFALSKFQSLQKQHFFFHLFIFVFVSFILTFLTKKAVFQVEMQKLCIFSILKFQKYFLVTL